MNEELNQFKKPKQGTVTPRVYAIFDVNSSVTEFALY